jgi:hypothetical protein
MTRLHAELGSRWAVLNGPDRFAELAKQRLGVDMVIELHAGDGGHARLVRPDGHLGWQGPPDPVPFGRWLDGVLSTPHSGTGDATT